jgi:hypothetical protein
MVAAGSLFLLCLSASSYHCRHGYSNDVRRHATPLFAVQSSSSSRSSALRLEDRKKSFLSARSAGIEGQIDDDVDMSTLDHRQLQWELKYLLLKQFQEREGHCKVPQSYKEDGANLGTWVAKQRWLKNMKKKKLDPIREKRLWEIGFEWGVASATWDEMYALLLQFKKREGHCTVPQSHKEDGANLGRWVGDQRQLKKKETLEPDRETRLEEIGFGWATYAATWDEMYALLEQYKKREGHCNVPQSHTEDGSNFGTWVSKQRQLKKKEKLEPDRQKRLAEIGFE